jgi:hypothetical protein
MNKERNIVGRDIQSIGGETLINLNDDLICNSTIERAKEEVFEMLYAYLNSTLHGFKKDQQDQIFHFYRLYEFYRKLVKSIDNKTINISREEAIKSCEQAF